jgi:type I restriction enzyme, R subunit
MSAPVRGLAQRRAIYLLRSLGWQSLSSAEAARSGGVLLLETLRERLRSINAFEYETGQVRLEEHAIEKAVEEISRAGDDLSITQANEKIWRLLRFGASVTQNVAGNPRTLTAQYIDWHAPANNVFHAVADFECDAGEQERADIVLFVNGIPWIVVDCQDRVEPQRYVPRLSRYAQLVLVAQLDRTAVGTVGTAQELWRSWREREEDTQMVEQFLRGLRLPDGAPIRNNTASAAQSSTIYEQDHLIHALCRPTQLLEFVGTYTFFVNGVRYLAREHQYFAVRALLERIEKRSPDGRRSGGIIWHTAGSGKSMTMIMAAQAILAKVNDSNPRVILVSDRAAMDAQLHHRLVSTGIECRQASTGRELLDLLQTVQIRVITTVLQKFDAAFRRHEVVVNDPNIFVMVDEAERSQYGQMAHSMRETLPRACFVGFTSTPLWRTAALFGDIIGQPYTFEQAIRDRAVVPVLYERRKLATEKLVAGAGMWGSVDARARDIGSHFKTHYEGTSWKGMVLAESRRDALAYKRILDVQGLVSSEVLISLGPRLPDLHEGLLSDFHLQVLDKYGSIQRYEHDVINRFNSADKPQILIVVEKFAGLDVPRNCALYITRTLPTPALAQAVARVNRSWGNKDHAVLVDYAGIAPGQFADLGVRSAKQPPPDIRDLRGTTVPPPRESTPRVTVTREAYQSALAHLAQEAGASLSDHIVDELAARIDKAVLARRRVDWRLSTEVQNLIKTAIEDEVFKVQDTYGLHLDFALIDSILERCLEIARREVR